MKRSCYRNFPQFCFGALLPHHLSSFTLSIAYPLFKKLPIAIETLDVMLDVD